MTRKYVFYGALIAIGMLSYNYWLIQRDNRMFESYYCQTIGCANER